MASKFLKANKFLFLEKKKIGERDEKFNEKPGKTRLEFKMRELENFSTTHTQAPRDSRRRATETICMTKEEAIACHKH